MHPGCLILVDSYTVSMILAFDRNGLLRFFFCLIHFLGIIKVLLYRLVFRYYLKFLIWLKQSNIPSKIMMSIIMHTRHIFD